jgi:hypothetical protein
MGFASGVQVREPQVRIAPSISILLPLAVIIDAICECMNPSAAFPLPAGLASELERKYFWWEPVGTSHRSDARILAQAMDLASFEEVQRLEKTLGPHRLADAMLSAEPGWISERSWEFWRRRLVLATGRTIPTSPPRRRFDELV